MIKFINGIAIKALRPWRIQSCEGHVVLKPYNTIDYLSCDVIKAQLREQDIQTFYNETAVNVENWTWDYFNCIIYDEDGNEVDTISIYDSDIEGLRITEIAELLFNMICDMQENNGEV